MRGMDQEMLPLKGGVPGIPETLAMKSLKGRGSGSWDSLRYVITTRKGPLKPLPKTVDNLRVCGVLLTLEDGSEKGLQNIKPMSTQPEKYVPETECHHNVWHVAICIIVMQM